tara:strand:- start:1816 stop:2724 length:909 start_codon:yes stop_codon:yes gene_type:complete
MSFWWVNQGATFEEAKDLGILWAPEEDKSGHKQPSWETLLLVRKDDVVFHFAKKKLRGISVAEGQSRIAEIRIRDKGQWKELGREIEVSPQDFDFTIDLEDIPMALRVGAEKGVDTPFDKRGKVKQGYLYGVSNDVAAFILKKLELVIESGPEPIEKQISELIGDFSAGTDRVSSGTSRREQAALRQRLLRQRLRAPCGICGRALSEGLLWAAHIKPRKDCSEKERLDINVAMLACVLGCDALFGKGIIYADEAGIVRVNGSQVTEEDLAAFVEGLEGKPAGAFSERSKNYFDWHRKNVAGA